MGNRAVPDGSGAFDCRRPQAAADYLHSGRVPIYIHYALCLRIAGEGSEDRECIIRNSLESGVLTCQDATFIYALFAL